MTLPASTPEEYVTLVDEARRPWFERLRATVAENIPDGFEETINYGMIGYVVPHSIYPEGYHCDPKAPLPFVNIAAQKNFLAFYHMGIYAFPPLHDWFIHEWNAASKTKLDMGKSCVRFKKADQIPFELIGRLVQKMTVDEWIDLYESVIRKR